MVITDSEGRAEYAHFKDRDSATEYSAGITKGEVLVRRASLRLLCRTYGKKGEGLMSNIFKEIYSVAWGDLCFMKHNFLNIYSRHSGKSDSLSDCFRIRSGPRRHDGWRSLHSIHNSRYCFPFVSELFVLFHGHALNVQRLYYGSFDEMMMCPLRVSSIVLGKPFSD